MRRGSLCFPGIEGHMVVNTGRSSQLASVATVKVRLTSQAALVAEVGTIVLDALLVSSECDLATTDSTQKCWSVARKTAGSFDKAFVALIHLACGLIAKGVGGYGEARQARGGGEMRR